VNRRVILFELLSLDGVADQPDEFITDFDEVMRENLRRVVATQDAVLLGHRTYDEWAAFWPSSQIEPFSTFINGVQKFVAASTALLPAWVNTTAIEGDLARFVSELKLRPGGDIGVHGSIALAQSLLETALVDGLRLVVAPAIRVHGRRLFAGTLPARLMLERQAVSPTGYLLLDYLMEN
jgi:dihydrofolate reductase